MLFSVEAEALFISWGLPDPDTHRNVNIELRLYSACVHKGPDSPTQGFGSHGPNRKEAQTEGLLHGDNGPGISCWRAGRASCCNQQKSHKCYMGPVPGCLHGVRLV